MWLPWLLFGCPAEWLGIPVPGEGPDAIAMDDLVRDVARLSRGDAAAPGEGGEAARRAFLAERWEQMGLEVREGGRCGYRAGTGHHTVAVTAAPGDGGDPSGQAPAAVAISVAKALHGRPPDPLAVWFCVGDPPEAVVWTAHVDATGIGAAAEGGDVDYRRLETAAHEVYAQLAAQLDGASG